MANPDVAQGLLRYNKSNEFGSLEPIMCKRMTLRRQSDGALLMHIYNRDWIETCKKTANQYFIDRIPVVLTSDCGRYEKIGELKDA